MSLPIFRPTEDPGPNFLMTLDRAGLSPFDSGGIASSLSTSNGQLSVPHGTTIVAFKFSDGVVMAGDRRATEGNFIAHRRIEKVFAADRYSGVAIAGAAGPAIEMVRLFQTQLEHYEKVEGVVLSLEGKANQLGQMIRANLPMAMQGLAVVPLFAGWDQIRGIGRIFAYDITGGRYEEVAFQTTGSGGRDAKGTIKAGLREDVPLSRQGALELAISALTEAAEEDSATGGPDLARKIFPVVATITSAGFEAASDEEIGAIAVEVFGNRRGIGGGQ
ncbi:proteasome subunit beta [Acidithrix sp. C25]|uniref:proteasome subunit beta n=1 Tax=Acidithrix sp. C25 TaxID=1671482 RepID=UPI0020BDCDCB|nr:proteasome subunit beta [Acidithrix sp. C25]